MFGQKGLTRAVHHDKMGLGAVNQSVGKVKPELQMPRTGLEQQMNTLFPLVCFRETNHIKLNPDTQAAAPRSWDLLWRHIG